MSEDLHAAVDAALDAPCTAVSDHGLDAVEQSVALWVDCDAPEELGESGVPPERVAKAVGAALRDLAACMAGRQVCRLQFRPGTYLAANWPADEPDADSMVQMIVAALTRPAREAAE